MITPQLIDFVRKQRATGISKADIEKSLAQNGWTPADIAEAFSVTLPSPPVARATPISSQPKANRKIILSATMIIASAAYAAWIYLTGSQQPSAIVTTTQTTQTVQSNSSQTDTAVSSTQTASTPTQTTSNTPTSQTTTAPVQTTPTQTAPAQPATPAGQYADGTYTGSSADAYYGTVQVKAYIQNGKLADVQFLQYPNDRSTSRAINNQAIPQLQSEAVSAQSANVDIVSGATYTSQAFIQSLGSALAQAKNS